MQTAIDAYALMHLHGRGSSFIRPGDFCSYAAMLAKSGSKASLDRLEALGGNLADFHRKDPAYQLAAHAVSYAAATSRGDAQAAFARGVHHPVAPRDGDEVLEQAFGRELPCTLCKIRCDTDGGLVAILGRLGEQL